MNRYLCIHGHFYQPPRENPWLEEVEVQDSANPFHDWNERIAAECYSPNAAARIKNGENRIVDIVNNYAHLSFNFGPTLLSWLERAQPDCYAKILEADAESVHQRGHGNALAQAYSHPILPLCSPRDCRTQIRWGIADFQHRFRRNPEGFWLPETAADLQTLRALVCEGIRYTILSPYQALRVRHPQGEWQDATEARFDPTRPYRVELGGGLSIVVFFYDGPIARSLAFGNGSYWGEEVIGAIEPGFDSSREHDEVLVVAVDGETFGHHKKGLDEALAQAFRQLEARDDIQVINLSQALDLVSVEWEAEIVDGASWSCAHGLERWRSDCGCSNGGQDGWNQSWRAPLREALDDLRGHLSQVFEQAGSQIFIDAWDARDRYIELVLDPGRSGVGAFLERHCQKQFDPAQTKTALKLLEMQRHELLMYTSCGWFFSEISGIETVQILKYAARAIQLAREISEVDLEPRFVESLAKANSNILQFSNGAGVWSQCVRPSVVSLSAVAAHYAMASIVDPEERSHRLASYPFELISRRKETVENASLAMGRLAVCSLPTGDVLDLSYCVLHLGGAEFRCCLRPYSDSAHGELEASLTRAMHSLTEVRRVMDHSFERDYSLRNLFLDERRFVANLLLRDFKRQYEEDFIRLFEENRNLMEFLLEIDSPSPSSLRAAASVALTKKMAEVADRFSSSSKDAPNRSEILAELVSLAQIARRFGVELEWQSIREVFQNLLEERLHLVGVPGEGSVPVEEMADFASFGEQFGLHLDLFSAQNRIWEWLGSWGKAAMGDESWEHIARRFWFDATTLKKRAVQAAESCSEHTQSGYVSSDSHQVSA
jgi:alpha-amylase/alpha-mannosidase (GH57 family)